jgi:hypothetical protein
MSAPKVSLIDTTPREKLAAAEAVLPLPFRTPSIVRGLQKVTSIKKTFYQTILTPPVHH